MGATASTPPTRPLHRVACGCGWVGYRVQPTSRACPACAADSQLLRPVWLAGCAPRRGRCCYLAHLWPPLRHAGHYAGFTIDLPRRWGEHLAGGYDPKTRKNTGKGARLLAAALHAGCTVELVRVWYGTQARALEQRLKQPHKSGSVRAGAARSLKPLCPVCSPGALHRYPNLPDPPPPPPRPRFIHDPVTWDADAEWDLAFPHLAYGAPALAAPARVGGGS
jgi:hypothetical protein